MNLLKIGPGLTLPLEAVTETVAILGIRGSGKTKTAVVLSEELLAQGQQIVVVDPTDVWYGLKSSRDGQRAGHPVVVLGGRHQDLPLTAADGATIADFVVDEGASVILSLRHFESQAEQRKLVTDFARRLYFRKGQEGKDVPLMVLIDEASLFVPQRVSGAEAQMVGAIQKLVRQGRSSGIGVTLIDQRASTVNKDVLTQLELLICHRTSSPQDRKALEAWVEQHDAGDHRAEVLKALAGLPRGTAWFWSPGWLDVFRQVPVRERKTFDSSRTPKAGERTVEPRKLAAVDLEGLRAKMAATLERAKAEDPKQLQRKVAELERELRTARAATPTAPAPEPIRVEVPVVAAADLAVLERCTGELARVLGEADQVSARIRDALAAARAIARAPAPVAPSSNARAPRVVPSRRQDTPSRRDAGSTPAGASAVSRSQQRILDALAFAESVGVHPLDKTQLALLADASPKSGGYFNNLGSLRTAGLIDYPAPATVAITEAGRAHADPSAAPQTSEELQRVLLARLSGSQARILEILIEAYPDVLAKDALAEAAGQSSTSGGYFNNLGRLRSLGLIDYPGPGRVVALPVLFLEAIR